MKISAESSRKIENMSLFCAMCVVAIHIGWDDGSFAGRFIAVAIKDGFATIAVPFFFVVSGFFLSLHFREDGWYVREVRKRIKSLLVPYFLWISIAIALVYPLTVYANIQANRPFSANLPSLMEAYGVNIFRVPAILGSLWYVRCLFVIVILSPMIKYAIKKFGIFWIIFLFVCLVVHSICMRILNGYGDSCVLKLLWGGPLSVRGLFYFSLGSYIVISDFHSKPNVVLSAGSGLLGSVLLMAHCLEEYFCLRSGIPYVAMSIPCFIYFVFSFIPNKPLPNYLRGCSFPIYLMHTLVFFVVGQLIRQLQFAMPMMVRNVLLFILGIGAPIVICNFLRDYMPRVSRLLFGGR